MIVTIKVMIEVSGKGEGGNGEKESMRVYILCTTLVIAVMRITKRWEERRNDNERRGRWKETIREKIILVTIRLMMV